MLLVLFSFVVVVVHGCGGLFWTKSDFNHLSVFSFEVFLNIYNGNIFPSLNPAKNFQFISR